MVTHNKGPLKGQLTVDNGTTATHSQRENHRAIKDFLSRMNEPAVQEAVRLASRADNQHPDGLNGRETAFERLHRHQIQPSTTDRGVIAGHNTASRVVGVKSAIIRV